MRIKSAITATQKPTGPKVAALKGSVGRVLHDGSGTEPWRAMVYSADGKVTIVTSRTPIDAKVGDDLIAFGLQVPSEDPHVPNEFLINDPQPAFNRVKRQMKNGMMVISGGADAPAGKRPGEIAIKTIAGIPQAVLTLRQGVTVVEPAETSPDPIIAWAAGLMKGVPFYGSVAIMDPVAFRPATPKGAIMRAAESVPLVGHVVKVPNMIRNYLKWNSAMPYSAPSFATAVLSKFIGNTAGLALPLMPDGQIGTDRDYKTGFVIPYSPFYTTNTLWSGFNALSSRAFAPKHALSPDFLKGFVIAHELGHTVQAGYGIIHANDKAGVNFGERFADSFATLAMAQKTGDFDSLKKLAGMRHGHLLLGGLSHWTGPAFDEAIRIAEDMHASGELQSASTDKLAKIASNIAKSYRLSQPEIDEILARRAKVLEAAGIQTMGKKKMQHPMKVGFALDPTGGAMGYKLLEAAANDPKKPLGAYTKNFLTTLAKVKETAWMPEELKDPAIRKQAAAVYAADMRATVKSASVSPEVVDTLLRGEQAANAGAGMFLKLRRALGLAKPAPKRDYDLAADRRNELANIAVEVELRMPEIIRDAAAKRDTIAPITLIRRRDFNTGLSKLMGLSAEDRLQVYMGSVRSELEALSTYRAKGDAGSLAKATQLARYRHDVAFALRADHAAWHKVNEVLGAEGANHVAVAARIAAPTYEPRDIGPALRRMHGIYESLGSNVTPQTNRPSDADLMKPEALAGANHPANANTLPFRKIPMPTPPWMAVGK